MPSNDSRNEKDQAHDLIDRLPAAQLSAVVTLLEAMLDPVSRAIAAAPEDDEPETDAERNAVAKSKAWFERHPNGGIPHDDVLAEFGVTPGDLRNRKA